MRSEGRRGTPAADCPRATTEREAVPGHAGPGAGERAGPVEVTAPVGRPPL